MKNISRDKLVIRDSFGIPYGNGEIWFEELDSLYSYTDIVQEKFLKDIEIIRRPSTSSFIGICLTDTMVDAQTSELIVNGLCGVEKPLKKIAFIGLDKHYKKLFDSLLKKRHCTFFYEFFIDTEKAKEWLIY